MDQQPNQKLEQLGINQTTEIPILCRCGGLPSKPERVKGCANRWVIRCQVKSCHAKNNGQGLHDTIIGWNRLSNHFYR